MDLRAEYPDLVQKHEEKNAFSCHIREEIHPDPEDDHGSCSIGASSASAAPSTDSSQKSTRSSDTDPKPSKKRILAWVDVITPLQAAAINMAICTFVVGCGLSFAIVESTFFIALLSVLRPAFIHGGFLKKRKWFSQKGLIRLHRTVTKDIAKVFDSGPENYRTLSGDGFKTESDAKVVNFTEQQGDKVAFKDSIYLGEDREDADWYFVNFKKQLASRPLSQWTAVVADNVGYMKSALAQLERVYKSLLCFGCVAHLLDLLCEDFAKILKPILDNVNFIVVFVTGHDRLKQMFLRIKGIRGIGLRTFPDTRFSYAALMCFSVLTNSSNLRDLIDTKHREAWKQATTNKDGSAVAKADVFRSLVGSMAFFDVIGCCLQLLQPVAAALRFIEGNNTRLSFVFPLMVALSADVNSWDSSEVDAYLEKEYPDVPRPVSSTIRTAFLKRWHGDGRLVGLFHPVHMVSLLLDPGLSFGGTLFPDAPGHLETIFSKYCDNEAEFSVVYSEFEAFHAGLGHWGPAKAMREKQAKAKAQGLQAAYMKKNAITDEAELSATQKAIFRCQASGDSLTFWKNHAPANSKLRYIALRVLSASPTACSVERMNSMHKRVASSGRAALKHERVIMLVFCYVNLRLLQNVDQDVLNMVDDALEDAIADADAVAAGAPPIDYDAISDDELEPTIVELDAE